MELLNEIVNADAERRAANTRHEDALKAHSFTKGDTITQNGRRLVEQHMQTYAAPPAYRGCGVDVSSAGNNVDAIREMAALKWNPVKIGAAALGPKGGVIDVPGEYWLFKSGTRDRIPVRSVTEEFIPHTNTQLLRMMAAFADEANLKITRVGQMDGGSLIWAAASSEVAENVAVGDVVGLTIVLRSGHGCGVATKVTAQAIRLSCTNGAIVSVKAGRVHLTHRAELTELRIANAIEYMQQANTAFREYVERVRPLYEVPATPAILRLALAQYLLTKGEDWAAVVKEATKGAIIPDPKEERRVGSDVIERVLLAEAGNKWFAQRMFNGMERQQPLLNAMVAAAENQPGEQTSKGTLAHVLNTVTYYDSHVRGSNRKGSAERQVRAGFDNDNAQGVLQLLERQYVPAIQQIMVGGR